MFQVSPQIVGFLSQIDGKMRESFCTDTMCQPLEVHAALSVLSAIKESRSKFYDLRSRDRKVYFPSNLVNKTILGR